MIFMLVQQLNQSRRRGEHRSEHKRGKLKSTLLREKRNELGIDKFYIELIEECKCDNIEQLRAREGMYIREMGTLNKRIEDRGRKEYWEQYYKDEKKEERLQYAKHYRENDPDKIRESQRKFSDNHKEEIKMKKSEYRHKNREILIEKGREYRENNREKVRQQALNYYYRQKNKLKCDETTKFTVDCENDTSTIRETIKND